MSFSSVRRSIGAATVLLAFVASGQTIASDWTIAAGPSVAWDDGAFTSERAFTASVRDGRHEIAVGRYDGEPIRGALRGGEFDIPDMWHFSATRYHLWREEKSLRPFFGIGAGYVTEKSRRGQSNLVFALQTGIELNRFRFIWRHLSNGGFDEVNKGFDYLGAEWSF